MEGPAFKDRNPQKQWEEILKGKPTPSQPKSPPLPKEKCKGRPRHEPGVMNSTERAYAAHLDQQLKAGKIKWWVFESLKLKLAYNTHYTVDFFVLADDDVLEAHEVKGGHIEDDAMVKIKVAANMFPFRFLLCVKKNKSTPWKIREIPRG